MNPNSTIVEYQGDRTITFAWSTPPDVQLDTMQSVEWLKNNPDSYSLNISEEIN